MEAYGSDYVTSLRTFEKLTNTQSCSWSVNYSGYNFNFKYNNNPIFECPIDCSNDIYAEELCGKLLFRYINNNIMPYITQGRYYSSSGKYINEKYTYKYRRSRIIKSVGDDCPLTGMCYDFYLLEPIIKYYKTWCSYPDNFSLTDLIEQCYDSFSNAGMKNMSIGPMMKMQSGRNYITTSMRTGCIIWMEESIVDR